MKALWHFFRLIRPLNLAVIAITMGVFQFFLSGYHKVLPPGQVFDYTVFSPEGYLIEPSIWNSGVFQLDFLLLVFSTLLIAAAGNIINDYFDVKADRVNKPDLLIIDKHIKRRWAIVLNWVFNSVGLLIALYLSLKYDLLLIAVIPFVCINLLWFYSMYFKRKLILGNLLVAFLTGIVPMYVLLFNREVSLSDFNGGIVAAFALYAFWLNLIREIVKDLADVDGDLLLNSKSMPISFGVTRTKFILFVLYVIAVIPLSFVVYAAIDIYQRQGFSDPKLVSVVVFPGLALVSVLISLFLLAGNVSRKRYLNSSNMLKLAMLFGLLTPLFL